MVCIYCGSPTGVTNSRHQKRLNNIWRRRTCPTCAGIFTTTERPELSSSIIVTDGDKQPAPLLRDRLFIDIYASCKHRVAAIEDASAITDIVIGMLAATRHKGALQRDVIVKTTHEVLQRFDAVAATMYAAYHKASTQKEYS